MNRTHAFRLALPAMLVAMPASAALASEVLNAEDTYYMHPSLTLSSWSQYWLYCGDAQVDFTGDVPELLASLTLDDFSDFSFEYCGVLGTDTEVKVGTKYTIDNPITLDEALASGYLDSRIIPDTTALYRIYNNNVRGYLRFTTLEDRTSSVGRGCFNFTSDPEEAEIFIFWDADNWLSQSERAQERISDTKATHPNEYYIIPQSALGNYGKHDNFGQLFMNFYNFYGDLSDPMSYGLGLDAMSDYYLEGQWNNNTQITYPWALVPTSHLRQYTLHIDHPEGCVEYSEVRHQDGETFNGADIQVSDLRVKPLTGYHYHIDIDDDQIYVRYDQHRQIMSLDELEEGHLYTLRSYLDRGYIVQNIDNRYNSQRDYQGTTLIGTWSDDVSYGTLAADYTTNDDMLWYIFPTWAESEQGRKQYYMANYASGRYLGPYYDFKYNADGSWKANRNNTYSFLQTQGSSDPQYAVAFLPGSVEGTFRFVSEMPRYYVPEINPANFDASVVGFTDIFYGVNEMPSDADWELLRECWAYAVPENANQGGQLYVRDYWAREDGTFFRKLLYDTYSDLGRQESGILETNPEALLWYIEDTGLTGPAPFLNITFTGVDAITADDVTLQLLTGTSKRKTFVEPFVDNSTRILSPYVSNSLAKCNVTCTINDDSPLAGLYDAPTVTKVDDYNFTVAFATSAIQQIRSDDGSALTAPAYDVTGRPAHEGQHGIVIRGGSVSWMR